MRASAALKGERKVKVRSNKRNSIETVLRKSFARGEKKNKIALGKPSVRGKRKELYWGIHSLLRENLLQDSALPLLNQSNDSQQVNQPGPPYKKNSFIFPPQSFGVLQIGFCI